MRLLASLDADKKQQGMKDDNQSIMMLIDTLKRVGVMPEARADLMGGGGALGLVAGWEPADGRPLPAGLITAPLPGRTSKTQDKNPNFALLNSLWGQ